MSRYGWEIQTSDTPGAGTDARVFLSLEGDKGKTQEVYLADPNAINDWERGDLNSGTFQSVDLGNLIRGSLRHDGSGLGSDWTVDLVTVRDLDAGRAWVSGVNATLKANAPIRLVFRPVSEEQSAPTQELPKSAAADLGTETAVVNLRGQPQQPSEPEATPATASIRRRTPPAARRMGELRRQLPKPHPMLPPGRETHAQLPSDGDIEQLLTQPPEEGAVPADVTAAAMREASSGVVVDESQLAAYRAQGYDDAQIQALLQSRVDTATDGTPLLSAEGQMMAGTEGQPRQSDEPDYGAEFEGFSSQSAAAVKLADEDAAVEV